MKISRNTRMSEKLSPNFAQYDYSMKDISSRADIELLVNRFYDRAKTDPLIGFFFSEVVPVNWPEHLPRMYDFWESIAFGTAGYKGEPMTVHMELNRKQTMEPAHFKRWVELFHATIESNFSGPKADELKARSASIAAIMKIKVAQA